MKQQPLRVILLVGLLILAGCERAETEPPDEHRIQVLRDSKTLTIQADGKNVLSYYYAVHDIPEGVDPLFRRSGFIHPLCSPDGHVLTQIQPADHYHHYGIWNPWTKVKIDDREVDFWNLGEGQGTVRFAGIESIQSGDAWGGFCVRHEHVDFKAPGGTQVVMEETWDIRAAAIPVQQQLAWIVDLTSTMKNVLDNDIELSQYRYGGGVGFRATEVWDRYNSSVLTSVGKTRKDADGTRARWCDINGQIGNKDHTSGVLFLSHPENRDHPEPMRVWPEDAVGGKGELFFEFCPIRLTAWTLEPGKNYVLRYRMVVYDGKLKPETMEALWQDYISHPINSLARVF